MIIQCECAPSFFFSAMALVEVPQIFWNYLGDIL